MCLPSWIARLRLVLISNHSVLSSNFCCSFIPCGATYVSTFDLSNHKERWNYQYRCEENTNVVKAPSESVQSMQVMKANKTTTPYSASAMEKDDDTIAFFIDSRYNNCTTHFCSDDICSAVTYSVLCAVNTRNLRREIFRSFSVGWIWLAQTSNNICTNWKLVGKF